jgi:hypothetical protein
MGVWYRDKKDVAEDYLKLSIFTMKRNGFFDRFYSGLITWKTVGGNERSVTAIIEPIRDSLRLRLIYAQTALKTGEKQEFNYTVDLTTTPCNFGELRYWFVCPLIKNGVKCNKRVGVLYKRGDYFGCRHCYNLSYQSRNENPRFRGYPWRVYTVEDKIEKLYGRMKRKYYGGRPTKAYWRIMQLKGLV